MRMTATVNIRFGMTKTELVESIMHIPDNASVSVRSVDGDRPWESSQSEIIFSWGRNPK